MKFGRKPRGHDPRVPKLSLLRRHPTPSPTPSPAPVLPTPPAAINYGQGMPQSLGAMLNDTLGDCVEAALGHSLQVWSANAGTEMVTPADAQIEAYYELAGGYVPGDPNTDDGTVIQAALSDWLTHALDGNTLAAFVELDQLSDLETIRRTIWECGLVFIGFNVPAYLTDNLMAAGSVWDVNLRADNDIVGGHCVIACGYDAAGNMNVISWGGFYTMTPAFWNQFVDEAYLLINADWIKSTGETPAGLDMSQLQSLMQEINMAPTPTPAALVAVIATLAVTSESLPASNAAQASNSVVVTDSAGTVYPAVVLTGAESTPWSWAASYAPGLATGVATALDALGAPIGAPVTSQFVVPTTPVTETYEAPSGISAVLATSSAAARARFNALKK